MSDEPTEIFDLHEYVIQTEERDYLIDTLLAHLRTLFMIYDTEGNLIDGTTDQVRTGAWKVLRKAYDNL